MSLNKYRETTAVCPHCKEEFTYHNGRGRNPIYCSSNCRKYAAAHRRYAREAGNPVRIIREKPHVEPRPEPKNIIVYQRPRKADMRAYIRQEPSKIIPDLLTELGYCLNDRKVPRTERAELARALGKALTRLAKSEYGFVRNEKTGTPISSELSPQEIAHYAQALGAFDELAAWIEAERKYTEYEKAVAIGRKVRKAEDAIRCETAGEMKQLQDQVRKLEQTLYGVEGELEQAHATIARMRESQKGGFEGPWDDYMAFATQASLGSPAYSAEKPSQKRCYTTPIEVYEVVNGAPVKKKTINPTVMISMNNKKVITSYPTTTHRC